MWLSILHIDAAVLQILLSLAEEEAQESQTIAEVYN